MEMADLPSLPGRHLCSFDAFSSPSPSLLACYLHLPLQPSDVVLKGNKLVFLVHYYVLGGGNGKVHTYMGGMRRKREA